MSAPPAFGTYRVLHQIGSGVLGPVFRAYDSQQDRLVAIKTIKIDLVPEDAMRLGDRFRAFVAAPAPHPAIIRAMDAGLERSTPFLALEYASGESLDVVIRQSGPSPMANALPILSVIADAIDASWAAGVGHGSLHPRDVFVDSGGTDLRISGFGVGQALEAVGARVPLRRPYSAPERASGPGWDIRADVFSLGVIAHEMLSGQRPLSSDSEEDGVAADLSPDLRAAVRRVLTVAMSESPADRYENALAFVNALATAAGEPVVAPAASRASSTSTAPAPAPASELPAPAPQPDPTPTAPEEPVALVVNQPEPVVLTPAQAEVPAPTQVEVAPVPTPVAAPPAPPVLRLPVSDRPLRQPAFAAERHVAPMLSPAVEPTPFPWAAVLAVLAAGLVAGAVGGYQVGWYRASQQSPSPMVATTVSVGPNTPVQTPEATSAPPVATPTAIPAPSPAPAGPAAAAAPMGRLMIQSVPSGALVMLDGQRVGETPLRLSAAMGRHEIQIARPGYVPRIERVELTRGSASRTVSVQLRRGAGSTVPTTGAVDVDSRPQRARVTVDGVVAGQTPLRVPELTAGSHRVQIALAGHKTVTSMVNIVGGEVTRLAVTLEQGGAGVQGSLAMRKVAMVEFPRSVR